MLELCVRYKEAIVVEVNIDIGYEGQAPLLCDIRLSLVPGEVISFIGDNGSGKTTLFRTLAGKIKPLRGDIPKQLSQSVALVSEGVVPPKELRVIDILECLNEGPVPTALESSVEDRLKTIEGRRVGQLSTGQRRLLEIFSALRSEKKVVVFDEAFSNLDFAYHKLCIQLARQMSDRIVLSASHDIFDSIALGGQIYFLDKEKHALEEYLGPRTVEDIHAFMDQRVASGRRDW